jgi:hypothetical protein
MASLWSTLLGIRGIEAGRGACGVDELVAERTKAASAGGIVKR